MLPNRNKTYCGIVAHRGAPTRYPENSLAGFKAVLNMAMLYPNTAVFMELDVRASRDGVALALHDRSLDRSHLRPGKLREMFAREVLEAPLKKVHEDPIDFDALKRALGSDAPLLPITPEDYRTPTVDELLHLTQKVNAWRMQRGTPVGLCFDLKNPVAVDALALSLNHFSETHPKAELPMLALGLRAFVPTSEMLRLWELLGAEARDHFYEKPQKDCELLRASDISGNIDGPIFSRITAKVRAAVIGITSPWTILGDTDPTVDRVSAYGLSDGPIRGNCNVVANAASARSAFAKQHLCWTDVPLETMQVFSELQGQDRGHADKRATGADASRCR